MNDSRRAEILRMSNEESNRITRECMQSAFIRLLETKDYKKITITEIVKVAGVSRNAFYRNYSTKEALLEDTISNAKESISLAIQEWESCKSEEKRRDLMTDVFNRIQFNKREFKSLLTIRKMLFDSQDMESMLTETAPATKYIVTARIASITGVISRWVMTGTKESPEEMAEICCRLIPEKIDSY